MQAVFVLDVAKNAFRAFPPTRRMYERRRRRRGYDPSKNDPGYVIGVFKWHSEAIARYRSISGRVLEIGPGGNLGVCGLFVVAGADEAVAIDIEPWVESDLTTSEELPFDRDVLKQVSYESPCEVETASFPDGSFDIIFSHASFEHFEDPDAAIRNIARMLAPAGITSHMIDLRDHRNFDRPLEFLRYGDFGWSLRASHLPGRPNRWRSSDYTEAFKRHGLDVLEATVTAQIPVTAEMQASFAPTFRSKSVEDLGALTVVLVAQKPVPDR